MKKYIVTIKQNKKGQLYFDLPKELRKQFKEGDKVTLKFVKDFTNDKGKRFLIPRT